VTAYTGEGVGVCEWSFVVEIERETLNFNAPTYFWRVEKELAFYRKHNYE